MLRLLIHRRERRHARRDVNRHVRPFTWGVEHLLHDPLARSVLPPATTGSALQAAAPAPVIADEREFVHQYAAQALAHSTQFFSAPATCDYHLQQGAQEGHLSFPSAIESPFAVNNTVHARFFPVASQGRAVLVLPQWNAEPESHVALCRLLNRVGLTALRLSLPYHDERKPAGLVRAEHLVSPNIGLTLQANRQAVLDVRRAADWLTQQGYQRIGLIGTSIGSCIAFLSLVHDPRFEVAVFNHGSSFFADVVWTGLSTQHVRQSIEQVMDLAELRQLWAVLSPQSYINHLTNRRQQTLLISGRYDLSFLPQLTTQLMQEMQRQKVSMRRVNLPCGHYTIGYFPFKYIDGYLIAQHLRKHL